MIEKLPLIKTQRATYLFENELLYLKINEIIDAINVRTPAAAEPKSLKLLPCPNCDGDGENLRMAVSSPKTCSIICTTCGMSGPIVAEHAFDPEYDENRVAQLRWNDLPRRSKP